jgi:hypothetical protein
LLPELLRTAGYYCSNNSKEDYNFNSQSKPWNDSSNKAHWRNRPDGTPFFSVFNFTTTHESQIRKRPHTQKLDPSRVTIPPYHPDLPEVRQDWAQYYDKIEEMDAQVGRLLAELKEQGLEEDTIVFYFGDHGSGMPRSKRWLYQSGLHVPMIVHLPEKYRDLVPRSTYSTGGTNDKLVSFVDLAPTVLELAKVPVPQWMHGESFFKADQQRPFNVGYRDRMDERIDMSRAIRNERYLYIRNFIRTAPKERIWITCSKPLRPLHGSKRSSGANSMKLSPFSGNLNPSKSCTICNPTHFRYKTSHRKAIYKLKRKN